MRDEHAAANASDARSTRPPASVTSIPSSFFSAWLMQVDAGRPIEQACYWLARRAERAPTPLVGPRAVDVGIVGAGLTGLWTALFLKELAPETNVVVVEQGIAAYGASGRNAGMLSETVDHGHALAIEHFGKAEARLLARLGETNVAEMVRFLAERGIDCEYEPTGRLVVALTPAQL